MEWPFLGGIKEEDPSFLRLQLTSGHAGTLPCASRMDLRFRLERIEAGAASPLLPTAVGGAPLLLLNATAVPASCHPSKRTSTPRKHKSSGAQMARNSSSICEC